MHAAGMPACRCASRYCAAVGPAGLAPRGAAGRRLDPFAPETGPRASVIAWTCRRSWTGTVASPGPVRSWTVGALPPSTDPNGGRRGGLPGYSPRERCYWSRDLSFQRAGASSCHAGMRRACWAGLGTEIRGADSPGRLSAPPFPAWASFPAANRRPTNEHRHQGATARGGPSAGGYPRKKILNDSAYLRAQSVTTYGHTSRNITRNIHQ